MNDLKDKIGATGASLICDAAERAGLSVEEMIAGKALEDLCNIAGAEYEQQSLDDARTSR